MKNTISILGVILAILATSPARAGSPDADFCKADYYQQRKELRQQAHIREERWDEDMAKLIALNRGRELLELDVKKLGWNLDGLAERREEVTKELRDCLRDGGPANEALCQSAANDNRVGLATDQLKWQKELKLKQAVLDEIRAGRGAALEARLRSETRMDGDWLEKTLSSERKEIAKEYRECLKDSGVISTLLDGQPAESQPSGAPSKHLPYEPAGTPADDGAVAALASPT